MKNKSQNEFEDFNIDKVRSIEKKDIILSVRITKKDFEWIKKNRVSASKFFNYALHKVIPEEIISEKK